ncbi:MAG: A/G-specific adenine glycosylase [Bacillota bacterium]|nr:A/G-specific adenine glycosylase [Bacillota bacterium]
MSYKMSESQEADNSRMLQEKQNGQMMQNDLVGLLLEWFDRSGRQLPWRLNKDPYRIWVSEIMLQQTQVQTVIPYFERFIAAFPTVTALAGADEESVLKLWEGLGYYTRARHLLAAARIVVSQHNGILPDLEPALRALPGIGAYTSGAISSIAWQKPVPAVDGNVVRVFARLTGNAWRSGDPADRNRVNALVQSLLPGDRPGDFNEAVMDLGATICLPQDPLCPACPLVNLCVARRENRIQELPVKKAKKDVPVEERTVLLLHCQDRWHVVRRPDSGLLAGLYTFDWLEGGPDQTQRMILHLTNNPSASWTRLPSLIHRFTHLVWQLEAIRIELDQPDLSLFSGFLSSPAEGQPPDGRWVSDRELEELPFPTAITFYRTSVLTDPLVQSEALDS